MKAAATENHFQSRKRKQTKSRKGESGGIKAEEQMDFEFSNFVFHIFLPEFPAANRWGRPFAPFCFPRHTSQRNPKKPVEAKPRQEVVKAKRHERESSPLLPQLPQPDFKDGAPFFLSLSFTSFPSARLGPFGFGPNLISHGSA